MEGFVGTREEEDGSVTIVLPIPPYTKKNSSRILYRTSADGKRTPFVSPSAQYKKYESECMFYLKELGIDYPVNVEARFYMATRRRVDLTNLNEALHDALVKGGVLADDDAKIVVSTDGSRAYHDPDNPRTVVRITRTEPTFPTETSGGKKKKKDA